MAGLTNLTRLELDNNFISDISALTGLTNLRSLDLGYNPIFDLSPLVANTGLGDGDWIDVWNRSNVPANHPDIAVLRERGVRVAYPFCRHERVAELSESIPPRDLDTVSVERRCFRYLDYLRPEWSHRPYA